MQSRIERLTARVPLDTKGRLRAASCLRNGRRLQAPTTGVRSSSSQAERGARPSQSVFLTGDRKADYFAASPADDARFVPVYAHSLQHTGGYGLDEAMRVAATLLPDILSYDPTQPARYPYNGRAFTDDVMDGFISILANAKVTGDGVGPHGDLLANLRYLGVPHRNR